MKTPLKTHLPARLVSFACAAVLTVAMLAGVDALAVSDAPAGLLARVAHLVHA